jgi:hypothetical protein
MDEKLYQLMRTDPWGACEAIQQQYGEKWQPEWFKVCDRYDVEKKRRGDGVSPALIADHQTKGIP